MSSATGTGASLPDTLPVNEAHSIAARKHAGQSRKANANSYLSHVVGVAEVLAGFGFDDEVVAAALLHDVVEHTSLELDEVRGRFGDRVAFLVEAMTDRDEIEDWEERKAEHRRRVHAAGRDASAIYAADKLAGIREARDGYAEVGEDVEERLRRPLDIRLRVWEEDLRMFESLDPPLPFTSEVADEMRRLRSDRGTSDPQT